MVRRPILFLFAVVFGFPTAGLAQDPTWRWSWDGNAFFGYNHQDRRYVDVSVW